MDAVFDRAQYLQQAEVDVEVRRAASAVSNQTIAGICRNCYEPVPGKNFCDAECRDEYEHDQYLKQIRGKR